MSGLGLAIDGFSPASLIAAQARVAEAGGVRILWVATHLYYRDPVALASAALAATTTLRVGLMAMSPYAIHPVHVAMAAATLHELHPGRVLLSLGVGAPAGLAAAGIQATRPVATLGEAIEICRRLLAGDAVTYRGEAYRLSGHALASPPGDLPIMLAATGPGMLALAGRAADGVLISGAASAPFVRRCLDLVDRAARGREVERHGTVYVNLGPAPPALRRTLGFILRGAHHRRNVELAGAGLDQAALRAAHAAGDWAALEALVTDGVVAAHAACGSAGEVAARLGEYRAAGLDTVVLGGLTEPDRIGATLAAVNRS